MRLHLGYRFILLVALLSWSVGEDASAQVPTDIGGFPEEMLFLGPYANPGGATPGVVAQDQDYLCDGTTSEDNILPEEGLELELPDTGGCAAANSSYTGFDVGLDAAPIVTRAIAGSDLLFDTAIGAIDFIMAYAWIYVINNGDDSRDVRLEVGSDDGVHIKVNRRTVHNNSVGRGSGVGVIDDRVSITLLPGPNLIQFKVFEGEGEHRVRMRLFDAETCSVVTSDSEDLEYSLGPHELTSDLAPASATRTVASREENGDVIADVSIAIDRGGADTVDIRETPGAGFVISNVSEGGEVVGSSVVWDNTAADTVSYTLTSPGGLCTDAGASISGDLIALGLLLGISGDTAIDGCDTPGYVTEVLVTPSYIIGGPDGQDFEGCTVTAAAMEGEWLSGVLEESGDDVTDRDIVPSEGLEFRPDFEGLELNSLGLTDIQIDAQDRFWTEPGDAFESGSRLVAVEAAVGGLYDWQRADIYGGDPNDTMNVAFFYVVNESDQPAPYHLGFGGDDSIALRVNGFPVLSVTACRAHPGFTEKASFTLDPGKNLISAYTFENTGGYNMCIRFEDEVGVPIFVPTTLDPEGYDPAAHEAPGTGDGGGGPVAGEHHISDLGLVTRFLVPGHPLDQGLSSNTNAGAAPEDYLTIDGDAPNADNVRPGAPVEAGSSGLITTSVRNDENLTELVEFRGSGGDPGLFNGETYYGGAPDNYSSTGLFFLNNVTEDNLDVYIGFASDDAASLYVDGELVLEFLVGRGFGGANVIQTGPALLSLEPGPHLVQLSYTEGMSGSGFRVGVFKDCAFIESFTVEELTICLSQEECTGGAGGPQFKRGDADGNGLVDVTDPIVNLTYQFVGGVEVSCLDALDDDDNGAIEVTDPINNLSVQFLGTGGIPAPGFMSCGPDPTEDALDCADYPAESCN